MEPGCWDSREKVNEQDNEELEKPFSELEIKDSAFSMEKNTAPGPDHIPVEFYQHCWDIIKGDLVDLFEDFHNSKLDIGRFNYGIITLLPKVKEANNIKQYRPICLLNVVYKIFTKTLMLRLDKIMGKIINRSQSGFLKDRNIMDGILALHEILHDTKIRKRDGLILKLDFEKAYDKLNWDFLQDCLRQRGFGSKWCDWIKLVINSGTVSVKVNNSTGSYFKSGRGVRQGDPLSPFLFNIAVDTLAKMINLAQRNNLIKGLVSEYIENGIAVLQYADDTILCIQDNKEQAAYLKLLLYLYEDMSGLKINFNKSEVIMVSQEESKSLDFSNMFNCSVGTWPIKYLGVPVAGSRIRIADWLPICEKIMKRLDGWKGSALSLGERLVLVNSCLRNLPVYAMSMFWLPNTILEKMDTAREKFLLAGVRYEEKVSFN
jgi:hypothetical protein